MLFITYLSSKGIKLLFMFLELIQATPQDLKYNNEETTAPNGQSSKVNKPIIVKSINFFIFSVLV